ncbi:MAG: type II toxin-antitoxin system HigB family toxin [Candidatus Riflebacteria bacterium]|nr:type II toxin-antitoxin system HigB family toxin [Candidatus Riflebacteria bacterium]
MRIISVKTLKDFAANHPNIKQPLKIWLDFVEKADWDSPAKIKSHFNTADFLPNDRVIFNIGGNNYRIVCAIKYPYRVMYVRFIGTHKEYGQIDAKTI